MSAVRDLEAKVQRLHLQLRDAQEKLRTARINECPIQVGDEVKVVRGLYNGSRFKVTEVRPVGAGLFRYMGSTRKKNGDWSLAQRFLGFDGDVQKVDDS